MFQVNKKNKKNKKNLYLYKEKRMFDNKFLITLLGLIVAVVAINYIKS